jgi:DNA-binding LytR/AlgR family response regulator
MESPIKVLIVEVGTLIATCIQTQLPKTEYEIASIVSSGEAALLSIRESPPDIVLMEILLEGEMDGVETARKILEVVNIPIIFLSGQSDEALFSKARKTRPSAFISKPFKPIDLNHAIQLATSSPGRSNSADSTKASPYILRDCIFVKDSEKMIKIAIEDILYVEAERNYCRFYCKDKEYLLVITLRKLEEKLPPEFFLRIHRSYIINISKVKEIGTGHVVISRNTLPLNKSSKSELLRRVQTI